MSTPEVTILFRSGATRTLRIDPTRVVGLDAEGRILVNDFTQPITDATGEVRSNGFLYGLTLCCNASDKGTEHGIVCRGCYGTSDTGAYYYAPYESAVADPVTTQGEREAFMAQEINLYTAGDCDYAGTVMRSDLIAALALAVEGNDGPIVDRLADALDRLTTGRTE